MRVERQMPNDRYSISKVIEESEINKFGSLEIHVCTELIVHWITNRVQALSRQRYKVGSRERLRHVQGI